MMVSLWTIPLAILGLLIAAYIYYKKSRNERLACVIGKDCNKVVRSKYSALFLGMPNEVVGMLYYGIVVALVLAVQQSSDVRVKVPLAFVLLLVSGLAALFSLVLLYIQLGVLREWCEYCLASSVVNIVLFFVEFFSM